MTRGGAEGRREGVEENDPEGSGEGKGAKEEGAEEKEGTETAEGMERTEGTTEGSKKRGRVEVGAENEGREAVAEDEGSKRGG